MNKYAGCEESEVCGGCQLYPTKPEAVPEEIIEFVAVGLDLNEIERGGGKFDYPNALTAIEWACVRGLTRGKDRAEGMRRTRERQEERLKKRKEDLKE